MVTIEDIEKWFEQHPGKPANKPQSKPQAKPTSIEPPEKFWTPEAVILWESSWECNCGCSGPATPQLFVRERMGKFTRLRAISSPNQYALLPRFHEQAPPSQIKSCPHCFAGQAEYTQHQLVLPFPEELERFKRQVIDAVDWAAVIDSLLEPEEKPPVPRNARSRETPLPSNWEFIPRDDEFIIGNHRSIYRHSVASEFGPELPHCWYEEIEL